MIPSKLRSCLFVLSGLLLFSFINGCQDDNIVGSSFVDGDRNIIVDTLSLSSFDRADLRTYTGNLAHFSAGSYNDQLFGQIDATGFMYPNLPSSTTELNEDAEMFILFRPVAFYGDTTQVATFSVHRVTERWRPNSVNADSDIQFEPESIGTFSVSTETDSVAFRLPDEYYEMYRTEYHEFENLDERDDNFRNNEFGFAIVPVGGNSIVSFQRTQQVAVDGGGTAFIGSRLLIVSEIEENDDEESSSATPFDENGDNDEEEEDGLSFLSVPLWGWGFNYDVENTDMINDGSFPVLNTYRDMLKFDVDFENELFRDGIISRVELVLFEDLETMSSSLPEGHVRPENDQLRIYRLEDENLDFLVLDPPVLQPQRTVADASYRMNITNTVNSILLGAEFAGSLYISSRSNNGIITPKLINVTDTDPQRKPIIIVTRIDPEDI